jgi:hypothetical protein
MDLTRAVIEPIRINRIFMKLFKITNNAVVSECQRAFQFRLHTVRF